MRPPQELLDNLAFAAERPEEVIAALGDKCTDDEHAEIVRLYEIGLPPVSSANALSVMMGYNAGFVWSLLKRRSRHYRVFKVPKGSSTRQIEAPRIGLKLIQKWLSHHFERKWQPHEAVHGFVRGRSHISAARCHVGAEWILSVDVENFFPSTPESEVRSAIIALGYRRRESLNVLVPLCCFGTRLAQGAPTSPVLSNIALHPVDERIMNIALDSQAKFTRYADDIVLSGKGSVPDNLIRRLDSVFSNTVWRLSKRKREIAQLPNRLKVHGLLVHGEEVRLTKGYRNKIRAYEHLFREGKVGDKDKKRIIGHLTYASQVKSAHKRLG